MSSKTPLVDSNIRPDSIDKVLFTNDFASTLDKKNENFQGTPPQVNGNAVFLKQSFCRQQPEWAKRDGAFLVMRSAFVHSSHPSVIEVRRRNIAVNICAPRSVFHAKFSRRNFGQTAISRRECDNLRGRSAFEMPRLLYRTDHSQHSRVRVEECPQNGRRPCGVPCQNDILS